jgi:hypothetical protein
VDLDREHAGNDVGEVLREVARDGRVLASADLLEELSHGSRSEWKLETHKLIKQDSERPHIRSLVIGLSIPDFRGGVEGCASLRVKEGLLINDL